MCTGVPEGETGLGRRKKQSMHKQSTASLAYPKNISCEYYMRDIAYLYCSELFDHYYTKLKNKCILTYRKNIKLWLGQKKKVNLIFSL